MARDSVNVGSNGRWFASRIGHAALVGAITGAIGGGIGAGAGLAFKGASVAVQFGATMIVAAGIDVGTQYFTGGRSFKNFSWTSLGITLVVTALTFGLAHHVATTRPTPTAGATAEASAAAAPHETVPAPAAPHEAAPAPAAPHEAAPAPAAPHEAAPAPAAPHEAAPTPAAPHEAPPAPAAPHEAAPAPAAPHEAAPAPAAPHEAEPAPAAPHEAAPAPAAPHETAPRPSTGGPETELPVTERTAPAEGAPSEPRPPEPTRSPTAEEATLLEGTATKTGEELSPSEALAERNLARQGEATSIDDPPFTTRRELPNGHEIRETADGEFFERCSSRCGIYNRDGEFVGVEEEGLPEFATEAAQTGSDVAHDVGVQQGREAAAAEGLSEAPDWVNPLENRGKYGNGFDDVLLDAQGNEVIAEYKGGEAELAPNQMEREWVQDVINRMRETGDTTWADRLQAALDSGRLRGVAYSTPIDPATGVPGPTRVIGRWQY